MLGTLQAGLMGGAAQFKPTDLGATLKLWLRADLGITQAGTVSQWLDQSGSALVFAQAVSGARPTYTASAINGQPGLTGAFTHYLDTTGNAVSASAARTFFAVLAASATQASFFQHRIATGYSNILSPATSGYVESNQVDTNCQDSGTIAAGNYIYEMTFDGTTTHLPVLKLNGVTQTLVNAAGVGVGTESGSGMRVLGDSNAVVCEFVVCDTVLSAPNALAMRTYMSQRYGITIS